MDEPIGRKSIRKTLENLRAYINLKSDLLRIEEKCFYEILENFRKDLDAKGRIEIDFLNVVLDYSNSVNDFIRALLLYVEALESYISELDETFDSLLQDAKKMAEQQICELQRNKPSFYG